MKSYLQEFHELKLVCIPIYAKTQTEMHPINGCIMTVPEVIYTINSGEWVITTRCYDNQKGLLHLLLERNRTAVSLGNYH